MTGFMLAVLPFALIMAGLAVGMLVHGLYRPEVEGPPLAKAVDVAEGRR